MGIRRAYPLSGIAYSDNLEWLAHEKQKVVNMMWNSLVFMWFSDFHVVQWFHVYTFLFPPNPVLRGRNEGVWPFGVKHHVFGLAKRMQAIGVALAKAEKVQFCFKFPSTNHVRSSWNTSEYNMNKSWTNTILNISIMFRCLFLLFFYLKQNDAELLSMCFLSVLFGMSLENLTIQFKFLNFWTLTVQAKQCTIGR